MAEVDASAFPPGTIGVAGGEFLRYGSFVHSLATTRTPPNTQVNMMQSLSLVENFNVIVHSMREDCEWLWIQSDDQSWLGHSLLTLLQAMWERDLDVLVPLIVRRSPPWNPVIYKDQTEDGYAWFQWDELPGPGDDPVFPVYAAGTGGMLIRRRCLDRIIEWQGHRDVFEYEAGTNLAEDFLLCRKMRETGHTIYATSEVTLGHSAIFTARPARDVDDAWGVAFDMGTNKDGSTSTLFVRPPADTRG